MIERKFCRGVFAVVLCMLVTVTMAEEVAAVGEVIDAKGDEYIRREVNAGWQPLEIGTALRVGDELKTGDFGALALLFADETQVRLHRNSYFVVEEVRDTNEVSSQFKLIQGALWSRATALLKFVTGVVKPRQIVTLQTPTTTIGIRGTDWYVNVDKATGASRVVLLTGEARVYNEFGEVSVAAGEEARVEPGQAPVKRVVVDVKDTPLFVLEYSPRWFDFFQLSGRSYQELDNLQQNNFANLDPLSRAEAEYDLGQFENARSSLSASPRKDTDQGRLLQALLDAQTGPSSASQNTFASLANSTQQKIAIRAQLAEVASLMTAKQYQAAQTRLDAISESQHPEVMLFKSIMAFQAGDYPSTFQLALAGANQYPKENRFQVVLANAYLLTDQPQQLRQTLDSIFAQDKDNLPALHLEGLYYSSIKPNAQMAIASFQRALEINPNLYTSRNNLALLYWDLGDFDESIHQLALAKESSQDESLIFANLGYQAANLEYFAEADDYYRQALEQDPSQPVAISGEAYLALARGENEAAIDKFLQLIAVNPKQPGAHTSLAIAYYQVGRRAAAQAAIDRAIALDPNDPVAPQIAATFALDLADVAKAIPYAQDALEKSLKYDYYAVESLASARNGLTNIGSAYLNLGLTDWANYYAQLSFTPYLANSHALLSTVYSPRGIRAQNSTLNLSLTLEPTAITVPNRYFQFIREPDNFFTLGGAIGEQDDATNWSGSFSGQGFARLPTPVAYRVDYSRNHNDGLRINSDSETETLNLGLGTHLPGRKHHFNLNLFASQSESGAPGDITDNDPDDRNESTALNAALSYHLRLAFDSRVLARIGFNKNRINFNNPSAFGRNLSDRLYSLLLNFGEDTARTVSQQGLTDINAVVVPPCTVAEPCIGVGPLFTGLGPAILDVFPDTIDDDITAASKAVVDTYYLQFRHMLNVHDVDLTYGVELQPQRSNATTVFSDFDVLGTGVLFTDFVTQFPFVSVAGRDLLVQSNVDPFAAAVFSQARWKMTEELWFDGGLFVRHYDDDITDPITRLDPRFGVGWRVSDQHWLRAGYQRELVVPVAPLGTLSPVATMGFVSPLTQVLNGSRLENLQLQWDAQWHQRVFTAFRYERQHIDGWTQLFAPGLLSSTLFVDQARLHTVEMALNVWLLKRFGLSAKYALNDTENVSGSIHQGNDLPLVAAENFAVSLNWIHPKQIRASVGLQYVGDRFSDLANTQELSSYWTTSFSVGWQPFDRHIALGFSVDNIFNRGFDLAQGFPAGGRSVLATVEVRF